MKSGDIDYDNLPQPNQRLYDVIRDKTNGVVKAFAVEIGLNRQNLDRIFKIDKRTGKYPSVPPALLEAVARVYNIRYNWLLTGEGEMKEEQADQNGEQEQDTRTDISRLISIIEKKDEQIDRLITLLEKEAERTEAITRRAV